MVSKSSPLAAALLLGGLLAFAGPVSAAWNVSGTVKSDKGSTLDGVEVTVKDSASSLKATTANGGQFSITQSAGVLDRANPLDFSVHQMGNELLIALPGSGTVELSLVDVSGAVLWAGKSALVEGYARATLPAFSSVGPAILRVASGNQRASQLVTLLGANGIRMNPRVSARSMAAFPTLVFKKTGYADTTYVMTAQSQSGITVVMRDNSQPQSTVCKLPPSPNPGSGSYTKYYFGQGTPVIDGYNRTGCGYRGSETGGEMSSKLNNIANPQYFVAIPGNSDEDFNTIGMCGACVELTGEGGKKIIATIADECPKTYNNGTQRNQPCIDNFNGHLDVSVPGLSALGYSSTGYPKGTTWKYVKCPITGNVVVRLRKGNTAEVFVENVILPIKDVKRNGVSAIERVKDGAWKLPSNARPSTLTIVDYSDRTITVAIPSTLSPDTDFNTGVQFPACQ